MKVLVTGGPTAVYIDEVRYLTNQSTGKTASIITDHLLKDKAEVLGLFSSKGIQPNLAETKPFFTFSQFQNSLKQILSNHEFDWVIHAAAVSDFTPKTDEESHGPLRKLNSESEIQLQLKPTPKLIGEIQKYSKNAKVKIIAFKLTVGAKPEEVQTKVSKLFGYPGVELVVHNDLREFQNHQLHPFHLYDRSGLFKSVEGALALGQELAHQIRSRS
ncbi:MAG: hypothetical protein IT289_10475 [Oligoflexia bacterium]|nr:hypothetical protein [Oligoflexia bacterium]